MSCRQRNREVMSLTLLFHSLQRCWKMALQSKQDESINNSTSLGFTLTSSCADIGNEAAAAGVGLGRAHLAGVAPGSAHGGAAEGFCADNPAELSLAHLVADHSEARACPVI